jgi:hypothetical protein
MKMFCLHATIVDDNSTVGKHPIDVKEQQLDLCSFLADWDGNSVHGKN